MNFKSDLRTTLIAFSCMVLHLVFPLAGYFQLITQALVHT